MSNICQLHRCTSRVLSFLVAFSLLLTAMQLRELARLHGSALYNDDHRSHEYPSVGRKALLSGEHQHLYMELYISSTDAESLGEVEPEYISSTLDWWPLGTEAWGNASVLNADLRHPTLMAAARGLSPSFLRVGGTEADEILYHMGVDHEGDGAVTDECQRHPQRCLTGGKWDEVLNFARDVGARIVFTIAYVRHTRDVEGNNDVMDWNPANARRLLEYTHANEEHASLGTVYGFELGNELRHKGKMANVTRMVEAYQALGRMTETIWGEGQHPRPKLLGPASTGSGGESSYLISQIGPHIDIATYHKYHGGRFDPNFPERASRPSFYVHPENLSGPGEAVEQYMTTKDAGMASRLWMGEGAMAYNSGLPGVSDSFRGSLWFANLLGAFAKTKPLSHGVYCRQSLLGGHYELVRHETMAPNPDYWVAHLWKELVDTKAVGPIISPGREDTVELSSWYTFGCCEEAYEDTVLIHSFCAKSDDKDGDVIFIVINISESMGINLNITMGGDRTEYVLRPADAGEEGMRSREVLLNGRPMSIGSSGIIHPGVRERGVSRVRNDLAHVPPISIAFVVVHGANVEECQ